MVNLTCVCRSEKKHFAYLFCLFVHMYVCYVCITISLGTHVHLAVCGGQSYQKSVVTLLPQFLKEDFSSSPEFTSMSNLGSQPACSRDSPQPGVCLCFWQTICWGYSMGRGLFVFRQEAISPYLFLCIIYLFLSDSGNFTWLLDSFEFSSWSVVSWVQVFQPLFSSKNLSFSSFITSVYTLECRDSPRLSDALLSL